MSSLFERFRLDDAPNTEELPTQVSGVHEAPTQPAPYVEEIGVAELGSIGSIPTTDLYVLFEPVVDLAIGGTLGLEVHPHSRTPGLEDPSELFARAVFEHRVGELGRLIRAQAMDAGAGSPLFLRVHPQELREGWLIRPDDAICSHDAEVFLEVAQPHYSSVCRQVLAEVRSRGGMSLCVDDFGAGVSSVLDVVQLSPSYVKVDAALIAGIDGDERRLRALERLVQLCHEMGAAVIAKGLQTPEEVQAVLSCGIRHGQGPALGLATTAG